MELIHSLSCCPGAHAAFDMQRTLLSAYNVQIVPVGAHWGAQLVVHDVPGKYALGVLQRTFKMPAAKKNSTLRLGVCPMASFNMRRPCTQKVMQLRKQ